MLTLSRSVAKGSVGGEPLPVAFPSWSERKMTFRRGSVHLLSGMAGSFKTMVLLNAITNMKRPTLAFSNDSDDLTVASRLLGIATGKDTESLEDWVSANPVAAGQELAQFDFLKWQFSPSPSLDDLWLELYAYHETEGQWPEILVVDILSNIGHDAGDEWSTLREIMRQANVIARETRTAVILVHHCTDGSRNKVPTRAEVLGKISALPVLMVNFGADSEGLWVAAVKNRFGPSDKNAEHPFRMTVRPECARVTDHIEIPRSLAYGGWGGDRHDYVGEGQW